MDILELNDTCFVAATNAVTSMALVFEEEVGRKPTVDEFAQMLHWGIKGTSNELFSDAVSQLAQSVTITVRKGGKTKLTPGDIFAIPRPHGGYFITVYVASNPRSGPLFGFFDYVLKRLQPFDPCKLNLLGGPLYSGKHAVLSGEWKFLTNVPKAAELFDANHPLYLDKRDFPDDDSVGEYGSASYVDGTRRAIDIDEAKAVGLLDGTYRQNVDEELVPDILERRMIGKSRIP